MHEQTRGRVLEIVSSKLEVPREKVQESSTLRDLGADSLDGVELLIELEQAFQLDIPDEEVEELCTLQQLVEYIDERLERRAPSHSRGANAHRARPAP